MPCNMTHGILDDVSFKGESGLNPVEKAQAVNWNKPWVRDGQVFGKKSTEVQSVGHAKVVEIFFLSS